MVAGRRTLVQGELLHGAPPVAPEGQLLDVAVEGEEVVVEAEERLEIAATLVLFATSVGDQGTFPTNVPVVEGE